MKRIVLIVIFVFQAILATSQNDSFIGNWEFDYGSEIFKVLLEEKDDGSIVGDYELIEKNSGNVIYKSRKDLNYGLVLKNSIFGGNNNSPLIALINDRTIIHPGYPVLLGDLKMELLNTSPYQTATWKVKRRQGVILSDDYREFNIPTDIILTKIEDNPVIDD